MVSPTANGPRAAVSTAAMSVESVSGVDVAAVTHTAVDTRLGMRTSALTGHPGRAAPFPLPLAWIVRRWAC